MTTSPLPSPASAPDAFRNRPPSVKTGLPCLKCTLDATATAAESAAQSATEVAMRMRVRDRIGWVPPCG
jgi:hypothetical protein